MPELGEELKQVGLPRSASLQGSPGARSDAALQPRSPFTAAPSSFGLRILVLPG